MPFTMTTPRRCMPILAGTVALSALLTSVAAPLGAQSVDPLVWAWGSQRAIIEVIEFTDFGCGFCAQFHRESYGTLFTEYVETGKVRWVFVPFESGRFPGSLEATVFAACAAEQGRQMPYLRRLLFERQRQWMNGEAAAVLTGYAEEMGLDASDYAACTASSAVRDRVRENERRAREAAVRGTPTLLVDGFPLMGALPLDFYRAMFDRTIAGTQRGRRVSTSNTPLPASRP